MSGLHNSESGQAVWCNSCNQWTYSDEDWHCGACGVICYYGAGPGTCPSCQQRTQGLRRGYAWQVLCDCHLSPADRARWQRSLDERAITEAETEKADRAREDKRAKEAVYAEAAADCWERRNHYCSVVKDHPEVPYCIKCPKFAQVNGCYRGGNNQQQSSRPGFTPFSNFQDLDVPG